MGGIYVLGFYTATQKWASRRELDGDCGAGEDKADDDIYDENESSELSVMRIPDPKDCWCLTAMTAI